MIASTVMVTGTKLCAMASGSIISQGFVRGRDVVANRTHKAMCIRKRCIYSGKKGHTNNSSDGEGPKFSWKEVFLQWALGMYISTPLIAIIQGSLLLNDYRSNYSDAPRPVMPARGVAIAIDESSSKGSSSTLPSWILHPFSSASNHPPGHGQPLRLLVVGDSLAAGVGMSKSGVPILPESIARALSKEMGGRPVYWTCVGTPGVSAAQIVKDIEEIDPYDPHPKGRQLDRIVKEFQNRRRRWMERREHNGNSDTATPHTDRDLQHPKKTPNAVREWWKRMRQKEKIDTEEIRNTTQEVLSEWWTSVRDVFRYRKHLVEEDLSTIKEIVTTPMPRLDDEDDEYYFDYYRENLPPDDAAGTNEYTSTESKKTGSEYKNDQRIPLVRRASIFRRTSIVPETAAQYDIAIVLTGLNDVKEAFMPHMNSGSSQGSARLEWRLRQVLEALEDKMGGSMNLEMNRDRNDQKNESIESSKAAEHPKNASNLANHHNHGHIRHPLVVVPELPVAPLRLFQLVPLCWFLIPIFRAMENNKRFLASCFPDNVVFVHQPDLDWWTNDEMGIGSIRENIKEEQLLLRVTDSVRSGRERIEELMQKYYSAKEEETVPSSLDRDGMGNSSTSCKSNNRSGSDLVSVDRIHPNDEGYELWGRHIAAAIIDHWRITNNNRQQDA